MAECRPACFDGASLEIPQPTIRDPVSEQLERVKALWAADIALAKTQAQSSQTLAELLAQPEEAA
jgi:hypothetical protein